ncbi:probable inorganic phosphate transporter 1-9 [Macadamia integrifolia]|uniref:probable inorganic phosphate transporter 1-9 n=1 Tax=Macadamia integrifolia TaxID=60698 RepID=UPI001C4FD85A|nr:probable inorganic phosphate transporter 1-9 [Macadamia integrifolia]
MGLKVLSALDTARTQYYHFKAIIIGGMGLFTDAYDLFCISPVMRLIGRLYYTADTADHGVTPPSIVSITLAIALLGTVIGQLVFGRLGDRVGRRRVYGLALMLMVFSSVGCGFSICRTRKCVLTSLCFFRFWLGVGIGGDYPLSATIMSEFANKVTRGSFIAAVFSMQGFGILFSSAVTMVVCAIFNRISGSPGPGSPTPDEADLAWRLILMLGAIPAAMTYYWRVMMPETARYTALVEQNIRQAVKDMERVLDEPAMNEIKEDEDLILPNPPSYGLFSRRFLQCHGRDLFGCAISWFLIDVVFYSNNLFQSQIYNRYLPKNATLNAYQEAFHVAKIQAIIAICSTIPGYWFTVAFIDRIGRVKIQMMGFFLLGLCLFAIGIPYDKYWGSHTNAGFLILYGLTFFFSNFGPNTTTFIVPAELFPARFRSTCHGISGAAGKVGAIIGSVGFLWASQNKNKKAVEHGYHQGIGMMESLELLGVICLVGMVFTFFFTHETMGRSLEENEREEGNDDSSLFRSLTINSSQMLHPPLNVVAADAAL